MNIGDQQRLQLEALKNRLKKIFSILNTGDLLVLKNSSIVVIRSKDGRSVMGRYPKRSESIVSRVFNDTYVWSEDKFALVGTDGNPPTWWSEDIEVHRGEGLKVAKNSQNILINADYSPDLIASGLSYYKEKSEEIDKMVSIFMRSESTYAPFRGLFEKSGVVFNEEQFLFIYTTMRELGYIKETLVEKTSSDSTV